MLVDAINHRRPGTATENTVLGPFYVDDPEERPLGADLADGAEGVPMLVEGTVSDVDGAAVAGAVVDTWQADAGGYYDVQLGEEHRLRARLRTGQDGRFSFWSLVPCSYPIPEDGPVGEMLRAQGRHPYRPAHVHFMISAPGFDKLVTHVFVAGDPYLSSDAVFGVKESLIRELDRFPAGSASDGREVASDWARLRYDFVLVRA
jgi:hydroxyquinol 1,2-dioxygenase